LLFLFYHLFGKGKNSKQTLSVQGEKRSGKMKHKPKKSERGGCGKWEKEMTVCGAKKRKE